MYALMDGSVQPARKDVLIVYSVPIVRRLAIVPTTPLVIRRRGSARIFVITDGRVSVVQRVSLVLVLSFFLNIPPAEMADRSAHADIYFV